MKQACLSILAALAMSACVHADEAGGPALVTAETELPASAKDSRDDGIVRWANDRPAKHPLLGQPLPAFELPMAGEGGTFDSASLAGRWTVMAVWGVWCHDSRNDAANINALGEALEDVPEIDFISVHVPYSAEHLDILYRKYGSVDVYFDGEGYDWPVALDETAAAREALQIQWTPSYLVIGPDLTIEAFRTDFSVGAADELDQFLSSLQALKATEE